MHSYSSLAKTWLSIRNSVSPGVTPYLGSERSFVFFLSRLTANERASISRAVLEMEANAMLYIQKHISARVGSRCSVNEPALLLLLERTKIAAEIEPG